jgi:hypothetical protein
VAQLLLNLNKLHHYIRVDGADTSKHNSLLHSGLLKLEKMKMTLVNTLAYYKPTTKLPTYIRVVGTDTSKHANLLQSRHLVLQFLELTQANTLAYYRVASSY